MIRRIKMDKIEFSGSVFKVQTLVDGGLRVTLDLPETEIASVARLMECKREGVYLEFAAQMVIPKQSYHQPEVTMSVSGERELIDALKAGAARIEVDA